MRVGIISDIHDNLWNLKRALSQLNEVDVLICCGDLCSPFVIPQLAAFPRDVHVVFGNNDADLFRITMNAAKHSNVHLHGELFRTELGGRRFGVNHFDYLAKPMAASGEFDVVCFGHNHERELGRAGDCLLVNPGPVMGAKFSNGYEDVEPSFAVYDSDHHAANLICF